MGTPLRSADAIFIIAANLEWRTSSCALARGATHMAMSLDVAREIGVNGRVIYLWRSVTWVALFILPIVARAEVTIVPVAEGWAANSVNAVVFRRNSVVTHGEEQYVAFYDETEHVTLAKRKLNSHEWQIRRTPYQGNVRDAHNAISIMVDGGGYLHLAWDHHGSPLRYCRSVASGSLELTDPLPMTGLHEQQVTYPEFYLLPDGNLLFLYRDGESGSGNLVLNHYDAQTQTWTQRQHALLDGTGQRNAYWQMCVDLRGTLHLSWVWRETYDVATNHDLGYARSRDGGVTWERSDGQPYALPITAEAAEYACRIPQGSELINSTSIAADARGRPFIATYWRPAGTTVPQYHLVYHDGAQWHTLQASQRTSPFTLSGGGTKRIPISRPQLAIKEADGVTTVYLVFRDVERGSRVSVAICDDVLKNNWRRVDLTPESVDMWEPSYDTQLWARKRRLHLFLQKVAQGDAEQTVDVAPTMVSILEWTSEKEQGATP